VEEDETSNSANSPSLLTDIKVTVTAGKAGNILEWVPVEGAVTYTVSRRESASTTSTKVTGTPAKTVKEGVEVWTLVDTVGDRNQLNSNAAYTYTVETKIGTATVKGEAGVTTAGLLPKGTKFAAPDAVEFQLNKETWKITVTVTPPADGNTALEYEVKVQNPDNPDKTKFAASGTVTAANLTAELDWNYTIDGPLTATATAKSPSTYYIASGAVSSQPQPFTALFTVKDVLKGELEKEPAIIVGNDGLPTTDPPTAENLSATLDFTTIGAKSGVTYTFERAKKREDGTFDAYAAVEFKVKELDTENSTDTDTIYLYTPFDTTSITELLIKMDTDSHIYDRTLPKESGVYRYRVTAEKNTEKQSKESGEVNVDIKEFVIGQIEVTKGTNIFTFKPSVKYAGILGENDKLSIKWIRGPADSFNKDDGSSRLDFANTDLDDPTSATATQETSTLPSNTGSGAKQSLFARAYLIFEDGAFVNISDTSNLKWVKTVTTGIAGIKSISSYKNKTEGDVYYATLDY
jgi:hypothetical protein